MRTTQLGAIAALMMMAGVAQAQALQTMDEIVNDAISPISDFISGIIFYSVRVAGNDFPLIVGWLILAGAVFTVYFGFLQFRGFHHAISLVKGDYADVTKREPGETSHFQALSMALSGTVGLGNIAGVAVAVTIGGAGATFWMILAGLLGMASKFTECTLGVKYRNEHPDGSVSGGPMYYLSKGLAEQGKARLGKARLGKVLAVIFAICCIGGSVGGGNMFQANQAFQQVVNVTGGAQSFLAGRGWLFGLVLAFAVGLVIIGGVKSIARVTSRVVPFMAILYVGTGLLILALNYDRIGWAFGQILSGAFTGEGVAGGMVGALIQGFKRAAFSNEAGIGSAAIAHSTVRTREPITEGYVALLEPFIDTVVICTMTALVIVITGRVGMEGLSGVQITSDAFGSAFWWFPYILAVAVVLFAFSTMIAWFYYGMKSFTYLVGENRTMETVFKLFFCLCVVIGASMSLAPVIDFSDAMIFIMAIPNVIGLYFLMPIVKRELALYQAKLASGHIQKRADLRPAH